MISMTAQAPATRQACADCALFEGCLPMGLASGQLRRLGELIMPAHRVPRGGYVFRAGGDTNTLAVVRRGTLKSAVLDEQGREQVVGFHLTGELLGLDGIAAGKYCRDVVALEDSEVCRIPYPELQKLSNDIPAVANYIQTTMSREISRAYGVMLLLGSMRAEMRLAFFLLDLSRRVLARGYSPTRLSLPMTRKEIGGYLGLKLESVSRLFSTFQRDGLIEVRGKAVNLVELGRLQEIVQDAHPQLGKLLENGDASVLNAQCAALNLA
ncbi:MAG: helix-turn-helix domain-containing protein [Proteobacteria bacterium]|nr:helix-turn-helix domain-containing protein [Pseudomonadota bacterium]